MSPSTENQAQANARHHIETIRKEAGLDDGEGEGRNVQNLQNALHTLADELYQKSTHFLLELIQNADDNQYDAPEPSLALTYKDRTLRIDCNERGFSEKNVEAICRVGSSTKAGADRATTYVGEKGIGFKSVFKAADVVWIASGVYTFKFDKRQVLGMIAPIWEAFPEPTEPSTTSMLLQLSPNYDEKKLLFDLKSFDPRMLIFLRRLKDVKITIHEKGTVWKTGLRKSISSSHSETAIELTQDNQKMKYLVSTYSAKNLPIEPKRPGAKESQIVLAFPDLGDRPPGPQKVYAFLPIRDYGFKFLLQGDFLLSASREDVLSDSPWNRALRREFVKAFVEVTRAYSSGNLCYIWPRFIPFKSMQFHFFEPARLEIIQTLSREPVLKSRKQTLTTPSSLIQVPPEYCDRDGVPMTSSPTNDGRYLCHRYDTSLNDALETLGVTKMTSKLFLLHLSTYIKLNPVAFEQKSHEWHTRLAEILMKLWFEAEYHDEIRRLPIVPLNDGRWVTSEEESVFLPQEAESCIAPEGFLLRLVREEYANNPTTRSLYSQLGLGVLGQESIALSLIRKHGHDSFDPRSMTVKDLISQAVFLFQARADVYQVVYVWFATNDGTRRTRAERAYMPSQAQYSASLYFAGRPDVPFIHPDYLTAVPDDAERWLDWLEHVAKISILPRLTEPDPEITGAFRLNEHFTFVMQQLKTGDFLLLLRDNWNHYSRWLEDDAGGYVSNSRGETRKMLKACREKLRTTLQQAQVQCLGGSKQPLQDTFLPIPELVTQANGQLPFVDVQDPLDQRWQRLKVLGLGVEGDVRFYLRSLEVMSGSKDPAVVERATVVLEQIQARHSELPDLVREFFKDKPLVCIPNKKAGGEPRWSKLQDCLWGGPECLRRFVALKNVYPSCQRLFRDFFLIADANVSDLVREAKHLTVGDPLSYLKALFLEIEKHLEKDEASTIVDTLQTHHIWPVSKTEHAEEWEFLGCARESASWFIADRVHLMESFRGVVPLLAFPVEDVLKMPLLIRRLGADKRKLTRSATSIAQVLGEARPDTSRQADLRSRTDFIARLVPQKESAKKEKTTKLRKAEVFFTTRVAQNWSVPFGAATKSGRSKDGNVVLSTEHEGLRVVFKDGYFEENKTPGDLVEAIASFCAIEDKNLFLLTIALTESPPKIQEYFQRHGVPALSLDEDPTEDFEDIDGYDPRKPTASGPRIVRGPALKTDLVRMFAPFESVMYGPKGPPLGGQYVGPRRAILIHKDPDGLETDDLYVEDDDEDDAKSIASKASSTLSGSTLGGGSRLRIFALSSRLGRRSGVTSETVRYENDEGLEFLGQKKVSQELQRMLGSAYDPDIHWTSPLRIRNGHRVFVRERNSDGKNKLYASFTLTDESKTFTQYLAQSYPEAARWVKRPPRYHLEVRTTAGDLGSEFSYSNDQLKMARVYAIPQTSQTNIPKDLYLLVRAFNAEKTISLQILVDPWSLYLEDVLQLKADKEYRGTFRGLRN